MNQALKLLHRNKLVYEYFLTKKILGEKDDISPEELLRRIGSLVKFAWRNHPGFYSDGRMENILLDYGKCLDKYVEKRETEDSLIRKVLCRSNYAILHVATELNKVGGHTRMLYQFIRRYKDGPQLLILTGQNMKEIPRWFLDGIGSNITIATLDSVRSLFDRAFVLRQVAGLCGKVLLYHHPHDVVPIMAFSHGQSPPVLIENHAHSWFWLGPSIADVVFTHSEFHKQFTLKTRPVRRVYFLRSTDTENVDTSFEWKDKRNAKKKVGMNPDATSIITVGTAEKFIPSGGYDFFETAKKVVTRFEGVEIFVLGISERSGLDRKVDLTSGRIHLVGPVSEIDDYYKAADIYLEALPQPSMGATIDCTPIGMCCPLLKYGAGRMFSTIPVLQSSLYEKYIGNVRDEREYLDKLGFLIGNPKVRLEIADEIRMKFVSRHSSEVIERSIGEMMELAEETRHFAEDIPDGIFFMDEDSSEIAGMSSLQSLDKVISYFEWDLSRKDKISICSVFALRFRYCFDVARYLLLMSRRKVNYLSRRLLKRRRFA